MKVYSLHYLRDNDPDLCGLMLVERDNTVEGTVSMTVWPDDMKEAKKWLTKFRARTPRVSLGGCPIGERFECRRRGQ